MRRNHIAVCQFFRIFAEHKQQLKTKNNEKTIDNRTDGVDCTDADSPESLCADLVYQRPGTDGSRRHDVRLYRPRRGRCRLLLDAGVARLLHQGHGQLAGSRLTLGSRELLLGRRPCLGLADHRAQRQVLLVRLCPHPSVAWHGHRRSCQRLAHRSVPRCHRQAALREWLVGPYRPDGDDRRRRSGMALLGQPPHLLREAEGGHGQPRWRGVQLRDDRGRLRRTRPVEARQEHEVQGHLYGRPVDYEEAAGGQCQEGQPGKGLLPALCSRRCA